MSSRTKDLELEEKSARFKSRKAAGQELAKKLNEFKSSRNLLVIGLARGGVAVASEVARFLGTPLQVIVVRKIGAPSQPELGIGAMSEDFEPFLDLEIIEKMEITEDEIVAVSMREAKTVLERSQLFHREHPLEDCSGKTVILVDDGIARGVSMLAAISYLRNQNPLQIIVAAPVIAAQSVQKLIPFAKQVLSLEEPDELSTISSWYADFKQVSDQEVLELLKAGPG